MAPPVYTAPIQKFRSQDDNTLSNLRTHLCPETSKYFVYWSDIQNAFEGIVYLQDESEERLLFMFDEYAELYSPLRIEHNPDDEYTVVCVDSGGDQSDSNYSQGSTVSSAPNEISTPLMRLFTTTMYLYERLEFAPNTLRATFLQLEANTRYYHSLLENVIEEMDEENVSAILDGKDRALEELRDLEKQIPDWNYRNICYNMFYRDHSRWDYATSKFFIVLPADPDSWENSDPSTRQFRFYFLCDNSKDDVSLKGIPQHVHLSNHPGYDLKRAHDFFQTYGDYVLRVLQVVKRGYSDNTYDIPSLDTYKVLWKRDAHPGGNLTKNTIRKLIDNTIDHIQEISPPKWIVEPGLTRSQSAAIKAYFDVQNGGNAEGDLHRYIDPKQHVSWTCKVHKQQYFDRQTLEALTDFVNDHGGYVDMRQATLRVELKSKTEADEFLFRLKDTKNTFNIAMKLNWSVTRSHLYTLCYSIAQTNTVVLETDSISFDIQSEDHVQHPKDLFANLTQQTNLQFIVLVNYPRPHQQRIYVSNYVLQSYFSPTQSIIPWLDLRDDLETFDLAVSAANEVSTCKEVVRKLPSILSEHGLLKATAVTVYQKAWTATFDLEAGAAFDVYLAGEQFPHALVSSGFLHILKVDPATLVLDRGFYDLMRINIGLEELEICAQGEILFIAEAAITSWRGSSLPLHLTLYRRTSDMQSRHVAELMVRRSGRDLPAGGATAVHESDIRIAEDITVLQWDCDCVYAQLSDFSATILDLATRQYPSVLSLFTLDISALSKAGLACVPHILSRSSLEYLCIVCTVFDADLSDPISRVLDSVQWSTVKSLVFYGSNIDGWIRLWPSSIDSLLLCLKVYGAGSDIQELSHSAALIIHQLMYANPLVELEFKNIQFKDKRDWILLCGGADPSVVATLDLDEKGKSLFVS
ncbi:hypothetical protein BG005_010973 [Podila minutissima]|nr:hypothetical protein BG005_010973 [Podila minutissima]